MGSSSVLTFAGLFVTTTMTNGVVASQSAIVCIVPVGSLDNGYNRVLWRHGIAWCPTMDKLTSKYHETKAPYVGVGSHLCGTEWQGHQTNLPVTWLFRHKSARESSPPTPDTIFSLAFLPNVQCNDHKAKSHKNWSVQAYRRAIHPLVNQKPRDQCVSCGG